MLAPTIHCWASSRHFIMLFMFVMVGFAVIYTFIDNFRRSDHSGPAKAGWALLIIALPMFGALLYILSRPGIEGTPRFDRQCDLYQRLD